jgi:hypothetical protein
MTKQELMEGWVASITAHNRGNEQVWTARFEIADPRQSEAVLKELETLDGALSPNGDDRQFLARFPASTVRDAVRIVADQGGVLCQRQSAVSLPYQSVCEHASRGR